MILRVIILLLTSVIFCHAGAHPMSAGKFWIAFREAVLSNDEAKILSMIKLPLEVHGISDSTPIRFYDRRELPQIFNKILRQPEYQLQNGKLVSKTVLGLLYEKKSISEKDLPYPDYFRFYQMEFERIEGHWYLVRAYLEDPP